MLTEWWSGTDCQLVVEEGEDLSNLGKEHAIVIMNHKYDIDWLMGWILAERHGILGVSGCRPFAVRLCWLIIRLDIIYHSVRLHGINIKSQIPHTDPSTKLNTNPEPCPFPLFHRLPQNRPPKCTQRTR